MSWHQNTEMRGVAWKGSVSKRHRIHGGLAEEMYLCCPISLLSWRFIAWPSIDYGSQRHQMVNGCQCWPMNVAGIATISLLDISVNIIRSLKLVLKLY